VATSVTENEQKSIVISASFELFTIMCFKSVDLGAIGQLSGGLTGMRFQECFSVAESIASCNVGLGLTVGF